jgi:hypothetical protein
MNKLVLLCLLFVPLGLRAQPGPQGGGLHITHLYLQRGCRLVRMDSAAVKVRRFVLADTIAQAPIRYEWAKKDDQADAWVQDFTWVPPGGAVRASRLHVQKGNRHMVIDFTHVRPAQPAGDTEILDTLVFQPGYFRVSLQPAPLQWRNGQFYVIRPRQQVQRTTNQRPISPMLLLPKKLERRE